MFKEQASDLAEFADNVWALDDSVLDQVAKKVGWLKNAKKEFHLAGRISSLYDVRGCWFHHVEFSEDEHKNEKTSAWELLKIIPKKTLRLIKYVVFHEIAHMLEKKHDRKFFKIIEQRFPDYLKCEKDLFSFWIRISEFQHSHCPPFR